METIRIENPRLTGGASDIQSRHRLAFVTIVGEELLLLLLLLLEKRLPAKESSDNYWKPTVEGSLMKSRQVFLR